MPMPMRRPNLNLPITTLLREVRVQIAVTANHNHTQSVISMSSSHEHAVVAASTTLLFYPSFFRSSLFALLTALRRAG